MRAAASIVSQSITITNSSIVKILKIEVNSLIN